MTRNSAPNGMRRSLGVASSSASVTMWARSAARERCQRSTSLSRPARPRSHSERSTRSLNSGRGGGGGADGVVMAEAAPLSSSPITGSAPAAHR